MKRSVLGLVLLAASCASTRASQSSQVPYVADPNKANEDATVLVCENEMPTGTNIATTRCRRVEDMKADRQNAQDMLMEGQRRSVPPMSR